MLFTSADIVSWIGGLVWPFTRIAAMLAIAPIFGARMVPMKAKLILALLLTWIVVPLIPPVPALSPFSAAGILVTMHQIIIGFAIGFSLQLVFATLVVAGQAVAMGMGLGFATLVDPQNGVSVPVIGQYFIVIATLLFVSMNGHLALIGVLVDSFESLPIGTGFLVREDMLAVFAWGGRMFKNALMVAMPAIVSLLLVNMSFGVVSRAAPQLNVFGVGFPVTLTLGFIILVFSVSSLLPQVELLTSEALTAASLLGTGVR